MRVDRHGILGNFRGRWAQKVTHSNRWKFGVDAGEFSWLERLGVTQKAAGSNPVAPARIFEVTILRSMCDSAIHRSSKKS